MINFSEWEPNKFRTYGGANGNKVCCMFNNEPYMVKFVHPKLDQTGPYSAISEYIGCHIFQMVGISSQETVLGKYSFQDGVDCWAVACKDFNVNGNQLQEFLNIKNACIESSEGGKGTSLLGVLDAIDQQNKIDPLVLKEHFWNMFIVDAFVGNFDRHNGNWGLLANEQQQSYEIAPIYDCGSCLYPRIREKDIGKILQDEALQNQRVYEVPPSALKDLSGNKLNYFAYISSGENEECNNALRRMQPKIDMEKIKVLIDSVPEISDERKQFYFIMLQLRKERILDYSLEKIQNLVKPNDIVLKFHQREEAILENQLPQIGAVGQYQKLYRNRMLQEQNETNRHLISSEVDTEIVARMFVEGIYSKSSIRQVLMDYSPRSISDSNYVDKIMTRAKDPKYKVPAVEKYGRDR